jgi:Pregnancy-associated plasma protein-A
VPVYFHVVHAGGVGNISDAIINAQMNVLNSAFAGFYGGAATGFSFELAGVTRTDNAAWHNAGPGTSAEREMKKALRRGGWDALNLYATTAGAYLGWAYFPGLPESQQYLDGIVVDWESMPRASRRYRGQYDLGQTATHEAGHWFYLHHTFNGGCNNWATTSTTPRRSGSRPSGVRRDRTAALSRGSTRSTTTWTTRSTPVTTSSRRARSCACRKLGSTSGPSAGRDRTEEGASGRPLRVRSRTALPSRNRPRCDSRGAPRIRARRGRGARFPAPTLRSSRSSASGSRAAAASRARE